MIGPPEMARELGIPRSTVFRLVQTLEDMGFLQRVENGRDYALGAGVLTLGFEYLGSLDLVELANPVLARLRDRTGCSAHLAIRRDADVIYLSRMPAARRSRAASMSAPRCRPMPPSWAAVMLADLPDAELGALYADRALTRFSEQTPTTLAALRAVLAEDRRRGYAISTAYFERGVTAVAAPVRDHAGRVIAAINVTMVDVAPDPRRLDGEIKDSVCDAARTISALLGAPDLGPADPGSAEPALARPLVAQRA